MKKHKLLKFILLATVILMGLCLYQISQVGDTLQYLFIAPKEEPPIEDTTPKADDDADVLIQNKHKTHAQRLLNTLADNKDELASIVSAYTLTGVAQQVSYSAENGNVATGKLSAVSLGDHDLNHKQILYGRNFYPEELKKGRRIVLLDEQVAIALFRVGDAVGQEISFPGCDKPYEVMGVIRHAKKVGDYENYGVYVPLVTAAEDCLPISYYMVSAKPIKGSGAATLFKSLMQPIAPDGTSWDLNREKTGATLFVRVFAFILGLSLLLVAVKWLNKRVIRFYERIKARLIHYYAIRLLPRIIGTILLLALCYALCAGAFALLVSFIVEPLYVYPEWLPTVLVEWADINTAFWNVWQGNAALMELRSPEILRLRYFTLMLQWLTAFAAMLVPTLLLVSKRAKQAS